MPRKPIQPPEGAEPSARTVSSYELIAADYARETAGGGRSEPQVRLAAVIPGGEVLEVGSGPGWDADALEDAGLRVRRTDVAQAFIDLQQARGSASIGWTSWWTTWAARTTASSLSPCSSMSRGNDSPVCSRGWPRPWHRPALSWSA